MHESLTQFFQQAGALPASVFLAVILIALFCVVFGYTIGSFCRGAKEADLREAEIQAAGAKAFWQGYERAMTEHRMDFLEEGESRRSLN
jgi:hypothetical protein